MAISPNGRFLYAIDAAHFGSAEHEFVAAYAIEGRTGKLNRLNRQSTRRDGVLLSGCGCHRQAVVVANYSTGSVARCRCMTMARWGRPLHSCSTADPALIRSVKRGQMRTALSSVRDNVLPWPPISASTRSSFIVSILTPPVSLPATAFRSAAAWFRPATPDISSERHTRVR